MSAQSWASIAMASFAVMGFAFGFLVGQARILHRLGYHWLTGERRVVLCKETGHDRRGA